MILKGGAIAYAQMGDPNASIPTPQPVFGRPMFGAFGAARRSTSITFVSQAAQANGIAQTLGLQKRVEAVRRCRDITKKDMITTTPHRASKSIPKPMKCASTASWRHANRPKNCRWRSVTSCFSDVVTAPSTARFGLARRRVLAFVWA
jgi:hypothetical protein